MTNTSTPSKADTCEWGDCGAAPTVEFKWYEAEREPPRDYVYCCAACASVIEARASAGLIEDPTKRRSL